MEIRLRQIYQATSVMTFSILFVAVHAQCSLREIPGRPHKAYVQMGDINIGTILSISQNSKTSSLCADAIRFVPVEFAEALVFAIESVNNDSLLLPNITLGFVMLDDCTKEATAVSQAIRFLPRDECSTPNTESTGATPIQASHSNHEKPKSFYDVVGVIGPLKSSNTIAVSYLLGPARIPQLSFLATSDELSKKAKHPFFMRVVPPDAYQMRAIIEFVLHQGWSYFSVVYSAGSYGELAASTIKVHAMSFGLCISAQHKISETATDSEYDDIIHDLLQDTKSRVVILVSGDSQMSKIFTSVHRLNATGTFIWIGTDGWADRLGSLPSEYSDSLLGSFTTTFYAPIVSEFYSYFKTVKPFTTKNPWFSEYWEKHFHCSFKLNSCDESREIIISEKSSVSFAIDSVYVYAHALNHLLSDRCPTLRGEDARRCVTGDLLLQYLKNISFNGYTGQIMFDEKGNLPGKYVVSQILPGNPLIQVEVKIIDVLESYKMTDVNPIVWDYVKPLDNGFGPSARFPKPMYPIKDKDTPVSVCSRLCEPGEQIVYMEQDCCWECRRCRENERLTNDRTSCKECPEFYWPDASSNFSTCIEITPDYPKPSDIYVICVMCASITGMFLSISVIVCYILHRKVRVIKASSRELSFLQLFAILLGYMTMMVYLLTPTSAACSVAFYMFCLSFNWLYAPLLVKTIRIYRIFESGRKGTRPLTVVSPMSQIMLASAIIFGQIVMCIVISLVSTPTSRLTHKIKTEKYVELSCDLTSAGFTSFLAYNLTLVLLCSVFAFKTRKLPTNFNESRFISMCVSTTLVIWLAFIPSYATSSREYLKSLYLSLALLLNHSVAMIFLFLTRIYAVYYVDEIETDSMAVGSNVNTFRSRTRNSVAPISSISNSFPVTRTGSKPNGK